MLFRSTKPLREPAAVVALVVLGDHGQSRRGKSHALAEPHAQGDVVAVAAYPVGVRPGRRRGVKPLDRKSVV